MMEDICRYCNDNNNKKNNSKRLSFKFFLSFKISLIVLVFSLSSCESTKKMEQYSELYSECPGTIYVAPVNDISPRRAVRETADSVYNLSLNIAAKQLYLTAADPMTAGGYYVLGPLASAQIAATETRTGKQLRTENINDYATDLGIDAVLFIDLIEWKHTNDSWTAVVEYTLRSTHSGAELMHTHVNATKFLPTDHRGNPKPLTDDLRFAQRYGCDLETAQRCRLVEILNQYVLRDLPLGSRARTYSTERYIPSHPDYFYLRIQRDGSVELFRAELIESANTETN